MCVPYYGFACGDCNAKRCSWENSCLPNIRKSQNVTFSPFVLCSSDASLNRSIRAMKCWIKGSVFILFITKHNPIHLACQNNIDRIFGERHISQTDGDKTIFRSKHKVGNAMFMNSKIHSQIDLMCS